MIAKGRAKQSMKKRATRGVLLIQNSRFIRIQQLAKYLAKPLKSMNDMRVAAGLPVITATGLNVIPRAAYV
jgi:hypothetical protein